MALSGKPQARFRFERAEVTSDATVLSKVRAVSAFSSARLAVM